MNWKDKTILGAIAGSGKFGINITKLTSIEDDNWFFAGIIDGDLFLERGEVNQKENTFEAEQVDISECKLIARHVDSMSDEELRHYQYEIPLKDISIGNNLTMETPEPFLYLLSIGVLPESLADEDVIWK